MVEDSQNPTLSEAPAESKAVQGAVGRAPAAVHIGSLFDHGTSDSFSFARSKLHEIVRHLGPSLGNVFLIPHPWIGLIFWFALAWTPRHAGFGLIGMFVALVYERALNIEEESHVGGGLKANALLAAVAAGWMTAPSGYALHIQIAIAIGAASTAFVLTAAILRMLENGQTPALLWGFCFTASGMFAMFPVATQMAAQKLTWWREPLVAPMDWVTAFLRSTGSLVFSPSLETGAIVIIAILLWSRTALAAGIVAWVAGAIVASELTNLGVVYHWLPSSYNYFVAGMAIGAYFIVPAYSSLALGAMAGIGASLFESALQSVMPELAYLPAAASLTIWCSMATFAFARNRAELWRNRWPRVPPEMAWWRDASWSERFGRNEPLLAMPVDGAALVAQGFDGNLSHLKKFRHALDFTRAPESTVSPENQTALEATIWNARVMAPAAGTVARVRDGVPDNVWGLSNFAEPWGNHVSIQLDQGGFALLAHLRQGSVAVSPGARVEIGSYLGNAGNSGRSPVPHLHLQVQESPEPGSPTMPFRLANYESRAGSGTLREWHAADVPPQGVVLKATKPDPVAYAILTSLAPGVAVWSVEENGVVPRMFRHEHATFQVEHVVDVRGRHRISSGRGNLLLALAPDAWRILEMRGRSPFLKALAHAVPSIPYGVAAGLSWTDLVPAVPSNWLQLAIAPYRRKPFVHCRSVCVACPAHSAEHLAIESAVQLTKPSTAISIACKIDRIRGPVAMDVTFDKGSVNYSMVSFSPMLLTR